MSSKGRVSATLKQANTPQKLPSAKTSQGVYHLNFSNVAYNLFHS